MHGAPLVFSTALTLASLGCTLASDLDGLQGGGAAAGAPAAGGSGAGGSAEPSPCAMGAIVGVCGASEKCTLSIPGQGVAAGWECGPAGPTAAWNTCSLDADCADGLWCEQGTGVCKPWCVDAATCPAGAACIAARQSDGTAIPGWTVCTAHCRPDNPGARCGTNATCIMLTIDDLDGPRLEGDCAASGGKKAGCLCQASADCAPGLACDPSDSKCHAWCETGGICAGGSQCGTQVVAYDETGFGQCAAPMCFNN